MWGPTSDGESSGVVETKDREHASQGHLLRPLRGDLPPGQDPPSHRRAARRSLPLVVAAPHERGRQERLSPLSTPGCCPAHTEPPPNKALARCECLPQTTNLWDVVERTRSNTMIPYLI